VPKKFRVVRLQAGRKGEKCARLILRLVSKKIDEGDEVEGGV
jgi:hypothetical protein